LTQIKNGGAPRTSLHRVIAQSQNNPDGTADIEEHPTAAFVVGAGNANT
jgi:hypothetical protein